MNTTKLKLTNPTDDELSAAVAEHVAGWKHVFKGNHTQIVYGYPPIPTGRGCGDAIVPGFATSADAVLPLLEKCQHFDHNWNCVHKQHWVWVKIEGRDKAVGSDPVFARAGSIALLRANGIEVEVTP